MPTNDEVIARGGGNFATTEMERAEDRAPRQEYPRRYKVSIHYEVEIEADCAVTAIDEFWVRHIVPNPDDWIAQTMKVEQL